MKESDLQAWFEARLADETLSDYITNERFLLQWDHDLQQRKLHAEAQTRVRVRRACHVLKSLCHSDKILANQSMHAPGEPQKRPDFLLQDSNGFYTLVELKTNRQAERQGIQELLAYSAELHEQVPFLVGVFLVMVAKDWGELLTKSSKGALFAGTCLLPIRVLGNFHDGIRLEINLEVLRAPAPPPISALHALTPYVLARSTTDSLEAMRIERDLIKLAERVYRDCQRVAQTGFLCVWRDQSDQSNLSTIGITLFSVDPHWMFSDGVWGCEELAEIAFNAQPGFMRRVLKKTNAQPWSTNPSFELMERSSQTLQAKLNLEWGTGGVNFESYILSVLSYYQTWETRRVLPFGTMCDFWNSGDRTAYASRRMTAAQLYDFVDEFDKYHARLYGVMEIGK